MPTSSSPMKKNVVADQFLRSSATDDRRKGRFSLVTLALFSSAAAILLCMYAPAVARAKEKPADVEIKAMKAHREEEVITVDTTVRNISEKPIKSLTVVYRFQDAGHQTVSTQRTEIDEPELAPRAESSILAQVPAMARAVSVELSVQGALGKDLRIKNPGPYRIE